MGLENREHYPGWIKKARLHSRLEEMIKWVFK